MPVLQARRGHAEEGERGLRDKVRIVWKDKPLPFHNRAKPAAMLGRVAYAQKGDKGFWDAHDELFDSHRSSKTRI